MVNSRVLFKLPSPIFTSVSLFNPFIINWLTWRRELDPISIFFKLVKEEKSSSVKLNSLQVLMANLNPFTKGGNLIPSSWLWMIAVQSNAFSFEIENLFVIRYSLFVIRYSLFVIHHFFLTYFFTFIKLPSRITKEWRLGRPVVMTDWTPRREFDPIVIFSKLVKGERSNSVKLAEFRLFEKIFKAVMFERALTEISIVCRRGRFPSWRVARWGRELDWNERECRL